MTTAAAAPADGSDEPALPEWRVGDSLQPLEREMIDNAAAGERLDLLDEPAPDLQAMRAWGPERTIRAAVLRRLLVESDWPVHAKGIRLRGVRISGAVDLEAATLRCPLWLSTCFFDDPQPVQLNYATASLLVIASSHLAGLQGDRLMVSKRLSLTGSTFTQPVRLLVAEITGQLNCRGAQLQGSDGDGDALVAEGLKVGGHMLLDEGFTAAGAIVLSAAEITGDLNCRGAQLQGSNTGGNALVADWLKVGSVFLGGGFTTAGALRLLDAEITGGLHCCGAQLQGSNTDGNALVADGLKVGGDTFLDGGSPQPAPSFFERLR